MAILIQTLHKTVIFLPIKTSAFWPPKVFIKETYDPKHSNSYNGLQSSHLRVISSEVMTCWNQENVSQAYETSVSKKRLHTKRTTLHFVVGNEQRFPLLLGTNNALRIFMVLSETKSASVIKKNSQRYCLFTVWNSDLFSNLFLRATFGRHD